MSRLSMPAETWCSEGEAARWRCPVLLHGVSSQVPVSELGESQVENKCLAPDAVGSSSVLRAGPACVPFRIYKCAIFGAGAVNC